MVDEPVIGLDDAYGLQTPDDNRDLYRRWAETYEREFIEPRGYVYHLAAVEQFIAAGGRGPVLDVGCGTGIVGEALAAAGLGPVDGADISPEMLALAAAKRTAGDDPVYRSLIEVDLTEATEIAPSSYAGVISTGVFTHGHLGPEPLEELFRIAATGAQFAIGINREVFGERGFGSRLDGAFATGVIGEYELVETPVYSKADDEYAASTAVIAVFRRGEAAV